MSKTQVRVRKSLVTTLRFFSNVVFKAGVLLETRKLVNSMKPPVNSINVNLKARLNVKNSLI